MDTDEHRYITPGAARLAVPSVSIRVHLWFQVLSLTGRARGLARLHIRSRGRGRASTFHVMISRDLRIASRPAPVACGPGRVCGRVHVILTVSLVGWPVRIWPPNGGGASVVSRRTGRLTRKPSGDTMAVTRRGMGASAKISCGGRKRHSRPRRPGATRREGDGEIPDRRRYRSRVAGAGDLPELGRQSAPSLGDASPALPLGRPQQTGPS